MIYLTAFAASFIFIGLKAMQQRNVAFDNYLWVLPTSYALAFVEVYVIYTIARTGYEFALVTAIGTGAGLGALTAMIIHRRYFKRG